MAVRFIGGGNRSSWKKPCDRLSFNMIKIRSLTCSPLLIWRGVGDLGKRSYRSHASTSNPMHHSMKIEIVKLWKCYISCYFTCIVYHDRQTHWGQKALTVIMTQQLTSMAMGRCLEITTLEINIIGRYGLRYQLLCKLHTLINHIMTNLFLQNISLGCVWTWKKINRKFPVKI